MMREHRHTILQKMRILLYCNHRRHPQLHRFRCYDDNLCRGRLLITKKRNVDADKETVVWVKTWVRIKLFISPIDAVTPPSDGKYTNYGEGPDHRRHKSFNQAVFK